jgi:uncharacterized protein DUF748
MPLLTDHDLLAVSDSVVRPQPRARRLRLCAVALGAGVAMAATAGRAHGEGGAPRSGATTAAAQDRAPGAAPHEKNRALEAQWAEVVVKARKDGHGKEVVAAVKLVKPRLRIFHAAPPPGEADAKEKAQKAKEEAAPPGERPEETIDLGEVLRKITPLEVDHIDILDGQVAFVDTSRKERPELWMHDLELSIENLTTRVHLTEGRPVLLTARATVARSGTLSMFLTVDPFEKGLTFSGRAALVGLQTAELYRFVEPATNVQAPEGTVDMFIEFDCRNGELTGGVKPVLKNVKVKPDDKGVFTVLKAWIADLAVKVFSDRVPGRNAVATVVPIKGTLNGPDVQVWPTIFGVLRNAFVEGLTSGYAHLPPATADKKEGVVTQGVKALSGPEPPKAQPAEGGDHPPPPPPRSGPVRKGGLPPGASP